MVSNSRNKLHQTTYKYYFRAQYRIVGAVNVTPESDHTPRVVYTLIAVCVSD